MAASNGIRWEEKPVVPLGHDDCEWVLSLYHGKYNSSLIMLCYHHIRPDMEVLLFNEHYEMGILMTP